MRRNKGSDNIATSGKLFMGIDTLCCALPMHAGQAERQHDVICQLHCCKAHHFPGTGKLVYTSLLSPQGFSSSPWLALPVWVVIHEVLAAGQPGWFGWAGKGDWREWCKYWPSVVSVVSVLSVIGRNCGLSLAPGDKTTKVWYT